MNNQPEEYQAVGQNEFLKKLKTIANPFALISASLASIFAFAMTISALTTSFGLPLATIQLVTTGGLTYGIWKLTKMTDGEQFIVQNPNHAKLIVMALLSFLVLFFLCLWQEQADFKQYCWIGVISEGFLVVSVLIYFLIEFRTKKSNTLQNFDDIHPEDARVLTELLKLLSILSRGVHIIMLVFAVCFIYFDSYYKINRGYAAFCFIFLLAVAIIDWSTDNQRSQNTVMDFFGYVNRNLTKSIYNALCALIIFFLAHTMSNLPPEIDHQSYVDEVSQILGYVASISLGVIAILNWMAHVIRKNPRSKPKEPTYELAGSKRERKRIFDDEYLNKTDADNYDESLDAETSLGI